MTRYEAATSGLEAVSKGTEYEAPAIVVLGRLEQLTQAFNAGGSSDIFCNTDWAS
jgi:hypothetical protein